MENSKIMVANAKWGRLVGGALNESKCVWRSIVAPKGNLIAVLK